MRRSFKNWVISILILSLAICLVKFVPVFAVEKNNVINNEDGAVIPSEIDFDFSNGNIKGLKPTYLNQLSAEQKKNIKIIIPNAINGVNVTSIATYAFYSNNQVNSGCIFTYLDLSQATSLLSIGDYAFYGYPQMKCELVLPDSINSIGRYAFANSGFTGTLVLPSGLSQISDSAFRQSNAAVGFTGKLVIPESVKDIQNCAFYNQTGITEVIFPNTLPLIIGTSAFRYTGLTGVLEIPESVQSLGTNAFGGTKLKGVYLPTVTSDKASSFLQSSTFSDCSLLTAVVCDESNYTAFNNSLDSSTKKKLGYQVEIEFNDGNGGVYTNLNRLYNLPLNLVETTDGSWQIDNNYKLPAMQNMSDNKQWNFNANAIDGVSEKSLVTGKTLYAVAVLEDPIITYSDDIEAVYNGDSFPLTVNATHPLYKEIGVAGEGDVVFVYTWTWLTIGASKPVLSGFDENEYLITDVRLPDYKIACRVIVQACKVINNKAVEFYRDTHDFGVLLKQAESTVHPVYPTNLINLQDGFPPITLSAGDTAGTIEWDQGQQLTAGTHDYTWTFTPESNTVGNSNYKVVKGTATLKAVNGKVLAIDIASSEHGKVTPNGIFEIGQGENLNFIFEPELGYSVSKAILNGKDITKEIVNNKYTLLDVQDNINLQVTFQKSQVDDVKNMIDQLPKVEEGQVITQEQVNTILDAKLNLEMVGDTENKITPEERATLCEALAQLPQLNTGLETTNLSLADKNILLENLTMEDILELKNNPDTTFNLNMKVEEVKPTLPEQTLLNLALKGGTLVNCLNIDVVKEMQTSQQIKTTNLTELKSPLKLIINIPKELIVDKDYKFFILRLHVENGKVRAERLEDEDDNPNTITISSDKYSMYALAFDKQSTTYTIDTIVEGQGQITPNGKIEINEGENQTFTFLPDEGNRIDDVILDNQHLGPISSYTIENIKQNHSLKVIFKKVELPETIFLTITFDSLGGSAVEAQTGLSAGTTLIEPIAPTKEGYTFTGWYKESNCITKWQFETDEVNVNMILYAGWEKDVTNTQVENNTTTTPSTGDNTQHYSLVGLLGSLIIMGYLVICIRKSKKQNQ